VESLTGAANLNVFKLDGFFVMHNQLSSPRFPIPQGTLDMLILQILSLEPAHGYGIAQRL